MAPPRILNFILTKFFFVSEDVKEGKNNKIHGLKNEAQRETKTKNFSSVENPEPL